MLKSFLFFIFIQIVFFLSTSAQSLLPLNTSFSLNNNFDIYGNINEYPFTSSKPLLKQITITDTSVFKFTSTKWIIRKLFSENLLSLDSVDYSLYLNPLFDFSITRDSHSKNHFKNTRGISINGIINHNLYFQTNYYETQASFADYITDYISVYSVVPGQARVKDFKSKAYDYGVATALISWSPLKNLNFTFGHDKVFFGDGYRSLLLSDFASPYPFIRITATFAKFQYLTMIASFQNLKEGNLIPDASTDWNAGYVKKTGTFHYLTWKPFNKIQFSFFEGTIWKANATGYVFKFDKFNPVPLFHTFEFGLNEKNNVLCGLNFNYLPIKQIRIYGQAIIDNLSLKNLSGNGYRENKTGYQFGFKTYNPFKFQNITIQGEFNTVRPYTYSYPFPIQSYTHYNQPLAHPLGANFYELLAISTYQYKRILFRIKHVYAKYGSDNISSNYGKNIFSGYAPSSEVNGNTTGQGISTTLNHSELQVCWLLNPKTNMNIFTGIVLRNEIKSRLSINDQLFFLGIRTSLYNEYFDF